MAAITYVARRVRLANTHNVLTRTRPFEGTASIGDVAIMNASGNWEIQGGTGRAFGLILGCTDGRLAVQDGDDVEVLMEGIVAGYDVDPGQIVYDGGDGTLADSGSQALGFGLNDGLLYIRPEL